MRFHAAVILGILVASCGPASTTSNTKPKPVAAPPKATVRPSESPARWVLLPSGSVTADARLMIEGVGTLFVGESGDRWLEKKGVGLVAAETLVAESVRGVMREGDRYAFVGATGNVHLTKDPLGPVVETRSSKTPLRSIAVGKKAIVGLQNGVLTRSADWGATWAPVSTPKVSGTLMQVAMLGSDGSALAAPQQVLASDDDGATWHVLATPGIGARRVVADANGDLLLEGLTASAVLRGSPLRLEKVVRAPTVGWDLPLSDAHGTLLGSDAVFSGSAALVGDRYLEAVQDTDNGERWRLAVAEIGKTPTLRQAAELEHCERVYVTGHGSTVIVGCAGQTSIPSSNKSKWGPAPGWTAMQLKLFRSNDSGVTFKEDGVALASDREKRMWLSPDGVLVIDGACKRSHSDYDCYDSPPVVRPPGSKTFAKAVSAPSSKFQRVIFGANNRAYALGTDAADRQVLFVSTNGGRDFTRRPLPPVLDDKGVAHTPRPGGAALGAEDNAVYVLAWSDQGKLIRYSASIDGTNALGQLLTLEVDAFDLHGRRGFAYSMNGAGYETADGAATWKRVSAPGVNSSLPLDAFVACSAYGCLLADRATRVGWDLPLGTALTAEAPPPPKKTAMRTPIKCSAEGEWKTVPALPGSFPNLSTNADLGGSTRWVLPRRDVQKGTLGAVAATVGPKGLETKELTLFPAGAVDSAGTVSMQVEGVAALRYNFKREKPPGTAVPPPKPTAPVKSYPYPPYPGPYYTKYVPIAPKQVVDVEVAWYVAATGKIHKGVIKAAGTLDPTKDVIDARELPSTARTAMLSIAAGGVHVRPFVSASADSPLFFVSETGKVEKLVWPELPTKDVRGRMLTMRIDAARIGGRSVVFGDTGSSSAGLQMFLAWANVGGSAWETRAWGLWPELEEARDAYVRFVESGEKPLLSVTAPATKNFGGAAFGVPIGPLKSDPDTTGPLPTQRVVGDPPRACPKGAAMPWRVLAPFMTGTRHPVTVSVDGKELLLATSIEVIRGGPSAEACVSEIEALAISSPTIKTPANDYSVLIPPDDLTHATLFRNNKTANELSVRTMSCAFVPGPLPEAFLQTPGFLE